MLRMSRCAGCSPASCARSLTGVRRRHRRRVRRPARSSSRTRSTPRSPTSSSASRRASTSRSRPSRRSRATSAAASSRCPPGTLEKVQAGRRRGGRRGRARDAGLDASTSKRRARSAATGRRRSSSPADAGALRPVHLRRGRAAPRTAGEVAMDKATADKGGFKVGDTRARRRPRRRRSRYTIVRHREDRRPGLARHRRACRCRSPRSQRIAQEPDQITSSRRRRRQRRDAGAAQGGGSARRSAAPPSSAPARSRPRSRPATSTTSLGFLTTALLVFAGDRRARRRLPDLQHVRGDGRAALARVRAAADARRLAPAGAQLGASSRRWSIGFARVGLGVLGGLLPRARRCARCWRRSGSSCPRPGTVIEPRTIIVGLLVGMIATVVSGFVPGAPRDAGAAGRGDARRRHAGRGRVRRRRRRRLAVVIALGLAALLLGLFGGSSGSARGLAARARRGRDDLRRRAARAGARAAAGARASGAPLERFQGMPGRLARENAERQPQRTAITASALMIGLALVVFTAIFAAGLRGSVDKVIDDQLSAALIVTHDDGFSPVPAGVGEGAARPCRASTRVADALRPGQRQGRRRQRAGHRRRPGTVTAALPARDRRRATCETLGALHDDQVLADTNWARTTGSRSATRSRSPRRPARRSPTRSPGSTRTRSACSAHSSSRTPR